jgi:hypothetical protein
MIEQTVFEVLAPLVNDRVYPLQMPQSQAAYPSVVYTRIASEPQNRLSAGASLDQVRMQIDCYDTTYLGAKTLAASVRSAMENASFKATLQFDSDFYEPEVKLYRVMADFYLWQRNA